MCDQAAANVDAISKTGEEKEDVREGDEEGRGEEGKGEKEEEDKNGFGIGQRARWHRWLRTIIR